MPYGLSGIMLGASIVFFAYIGFDSISTHAEEARNPQRDVPIGILVFAVALHGALHSGGGGDHRHGALPQHRHQGADRGGLPRDGRRGTEHFVARGRPA